ncbi:MAG: hypothetical protein GX240_06160 [Candidatus Atribacteria bacterium]|nr:hypothetical protein [Candidatus Atribacteria bacterium]
MQSIKRWITNNLDIKILALLMALILWFYISSQYNVMVEKYYEIEITPVNLDNSLSIKEIREKVTTGIKGPQNIVENITANKISGTVDLQSVLEPGEYIIGVDILTPKSTQITKIIPESIPITVEKIVSQVYVVEYNLIGLPKKGYSLENEPEIVPKEILITASESVHKMINLVKVDIDISDISENTEREEKVTVYTKDNAVLDSLNLKPDKVAVSIYVRKGYPEEILEVKPRIIGKPAPGFYISKIEATPNSLKIFGEYTRIINIDYLETIPIDVNGVSKTLTVKVTPLLAEGIYLAENQETLVEVQIQVDEKEEEKVFEDITVKPRNASPFIDYQLTPETVQVIVTGKHSILEGLKKEDIKAFVNLGDIELETVKVELEAILGVSMVTTIPEKVVVSTKR